MATDYFGRDKFAAIHKHIEPPANISVVHFSIMLKILAFLALAFYVPPVQTYAQSHKKQKATKGDKPYVSALG